MLHMAFLRASTTPAISHERWKTSALGWVLFISSCVLFCVSASAQIGTKSPAPAPAPASVIPQIAAPGWNELSQDQQSALLPLQKAWPDLSDGQRRKWIAVIKNFGKLSSQDQVKIQDRMEDWAALKPSERERARENFATAKLAPAGSKAGSWDEYQALPQDERDRLAAQALAKKPRAGKSGKALVISPPVQAPSAPANYPVQPTRGELRALLSPATLLPIQNHP